ncbi:MAG TPA: N,N-dimethylformamidase beta subunit family domain-containing protein [Ktedonobacteraceae bacterium]|nr:N,N-dimethylformamidase beta subunit family domain-containing protein [Ktedonobacteraceae bacterium]
MKHQILGIIRNKAGVMVVSLLLATMLLSGIPYAITHNSSFAGAKEAHAASLNPIQIENNKPGTAGWNDFASVLQPDAISGFGSKISVNHGDSIDLFVTTTAPSFTIDIFRTGYYQGLGARLVQSLGSFPGVHQAIPNPDPVTGMISCSGWTKTTTLTIPSSWVTGVYLAKLTASNGNASFIYFVVRNDGGNEDILFQTSVTTYQAYNLWGGTSLYDNQLANKALYPYAHATKVSFDRPFNPGDSNGAGHYFFFEYKMVYWLESQGYNVAYTTDVDTDTNASTLTNHKAFLSVGHDEYWSAGMRNTVQNAINAGVNVAFFSANAMYWQIRFEPNAAGVPDRVEVGYKDFATSSTAPGPDPQWNVNNSIVTTNWRDPVVNKPENAVIGVMYEQQEDKDYAYIVQNASNWIYAGTGFVNGSSVPGIVGYEYDKVWNNGFTPAGITVLSNSPVHGCCGGFASFANSTLYTAASGAKVFAAGTIQWSLGLANIQGNTYMNAGIQQTTTNILDNFTGITPASGVGLSPNSLSFGNQVVGTTSAAQTVTVTNTGTAALTINSIAVTGTNASDFAQTNNCPASPSTLAINASCTVNVTFDPGASGSRSASLTLTDNSADSPQTVALSGTGVATAPGVGLSPGSLSFGNQNTGTASTAQTVTLTNTGNAVLTINSITIAGTNAGDFGQTNTCPISPSTLAVNATCTISVTFTPAANGVRSGNVTITDNAGGSPQTIALSGTGVTTTPGLYFTDGFESGNFSQWTNAPGGTGQASVQTTVVNSGVYAAKLTNASGQYASVSTAFSGGAAPTLSYTRFYFNFATGLGTTPIAFAQDSSNHQRWLVYYDAGRQGLDIYFWNGAGQRFDLYSNTNVLSPNTWYSIELESNEITSGHGEVWLNGTSIGAFDGDLSTTQTYSKLVLDNEATGSAYFDDVQVASSYNGKLSAPIASLSPTSLNFGNQVVGTTSAAQTITVTNTGTAPLRVSSIVLTGTNASDFAQTGTCPTEDDLPPLAVNASCTLSVTFTPGASGTRSGALAITDNAAGSPQTVSLSGNGSTAGPLVSLSPTSLSFGNQNVGSTSAAQTVTLKNSGTAVLTISSIAVAGTNAGDFAQTNSCPISPSTLAVNATCTISVTFTPAANGSRTGSITFTDNAADSPETVGLSGTGATAGLYFTDGFESGDFSQWTNAPSGTGHASVQTTVVHSGANAAQLTNASGQYVSVSTAFNGGVAPTLSYTRFYFNFATGLGTTPIAFAQDSGNHLRWLIYYDAGRQGLDIYFWNGAGQRFDLYSNTNVLSPNTWYSIEVEANETTSGHGEVWLNGTSIGAFDGDLSTTQTYSKLVLDNEAIGSAYFDDVQVSGNFI